jgi:hypothetical protein
MLNSTLETSEFRSETGSDASEGARYGKAGTPSERSPVAVGI